MNAERHEELAALAALDLLTPVEQSEFAAALRTHPELQRLVDSLRSASAELAHTAPAAEPPAALRARLLTTVAALPAATPAPAAPPRAAGKLIAFPTWLAVAAAACFALTAAYFGQAYQTERLATESLRDAQRLADLALRDARNQLEAERLLARRELADALAKSTEASRQLAATRSEIDAARRDLAARSQDVTHLQRQLAAQGNLADYKISTLASLLGNTPQALAVAVWNPANQEGVLTVQKLPALPADKDYQLWVVDPQYPIPVDGGVFRVDPVTGEARVNFHPHQPVKTAAKFAVSLERKGGVPKAEGPMVLIGP